jgi:hypothetical protein
MHAAPASVISNSSFCIYGFCTILGINGDYFLEQLSKVYFCNDGFLYRTDRIIKYYIAKLRLQRVNTGPWKGMQGT